MGKLDKRVALITGAASGIGRAIAMKFADEGAWVSLIDVDSQRAETLASELRKSGKKAISIQCDVANENQVNQAVEQTKKEFGFIHILVNNAGISPLKPFEEIAKADWDRVMDINLTGPFLMTKASFSYIKNAGPIGRVINIRLSCRPDWRHRSWPALYRSQGRNYGNDKTTGKTARPV